MRNAVSQQTAVAVVYVAAIFLSTMDTTIVNVALPTIGRTFGVAPTAVDSVSIAYLVSLAVFVPASGWLGDRFGGKRTLLTAVAVFTVGSQLCGTASSLGELVLFRMTQGAGGGMLASVGMAMLLRAYPPEQRVRVSALLTVAIATAPTLGPVLGGLLVTDLSWRAVFSVNVPVGIAVTVFGALCLRRDVEHRPGGFDTAGFLLAAAGLGLVMYGVSVGPNVGWGSAEVLDAVSAGVVLLVALVIVELRRSAPIIDVRLLAERLFGAGSTIMAVESVAFLGTLYTVALYLQDGRGLSPLDAGLNTFPEALGVLTGAQLAGRLLYRKLGPRRHLLIGVAASSACIALLGLLGTGVNLWLVRIVLFGVGLAVGQVFVATQAVSFAAVSPAASGRASTVFNVGRRLGGAIGVAVATTAIGLVSPPDGGHIAPSAYRVAFLVAAAINLLGLWPARTVRDHDATNTIPPSRPRKKGNQHNVVLEPGVGHRGRGTEHSA
ncbi:MAG TPA: MDR family MFS transporter [Pseudonocardiaceae bacterium]|jgi:EmrB/QacA subfamily drug resistance transporter|nr:MDR family MFS transporter [Pseudonocardiaceae bacterium]